MRAIWARFLLFALAMLKHTRVGVRWSSLLAIVGAVPLGGCTYDTGVGGGTVVTETRDELYIDTVANLWTNNNYEVPVCWHPLTTASQAGKDAFEQIVRSQWEANTGLTFTGFIDCPTTASPWVPVRLYDGGTGVGGRSAYGIGGRLGGDGSQFPADAQINLAYDNALQKFPWFAAHEMGHTLAAIHEHKRPDGDAGSDRCVLPRGGNDQTDIQPGQFFASVHDPNSVMNYCSSLIGTNATNVLTPLDKLGGQMLYGRPPTATSELAFQRVVLSGIPPAFSFNSTGAANSFSHDGPGQYSVVFDRIGRSGGNVQVTPYNSVNRCNISFWGSGGANGVFTAINCFNPAGNLADTEFTASFVGHWESPGAPGTAYVWAFDPTSDLYTADGFYSFNSTGQSITIDRTSTGVYDVLFLGQNFSGGTAEVSAYVGDSNYCKIDSLTRVGSDKRVRVRCFSPAGSPVDTYYSLRLSNASPMGTPSYSYAIADQPTNTQTYTPSSGNRVAFRENFIGGTKNLSPLTVRRSSTGVYIVTLPQMPYTTDPLYLYKKSNLHVTAVGTGSEYCNISALTGDNLGQDEQATQALVICLNPQGTAFVDSKFMISYGSMLADAPDATIISTVERLPQNGSLGIGGLSLVSSNLYFTRSFDNVSGGQIMRLPTSGGTATSLVSGQSAIGLFADTNNLIWLGSNNTIKKSALDGTTVTTLASNQSLLNGNPTADSTNVYYRQAASQMGSAQKIMKLSRNGGTPVMLTSDEVSSELFSDGTSVFWSARTSTGGRIAKISVNGGAVTTLATKGGSALVRRNSTLYYIDGATNDLYKVGTGGGASTLIATGIALSGSTPSFPVAPVVKLATDGVNVYGATQNPGFSIFKASVNGGSPVPNATYLAFHEATRAPLVVDSSNVYFVETNGVNGYLTVAKTAK